MHLRTRANMKGSKLKQRIAAMKNLLLLEPIKCLDFLRLMSSAAPVMTDPGGIQEEMTITEGTNRLIRITTEDILKNCRDVMNNRDKYSARTPKYWDGKAAERTAQIIERDGTLNASRNNQVKALKDV
jgi:UDP-N-acetylglucosamine 2-epimerase (non-hydrolysing)